MDTNKTPIYPFEPWNVSEDYLDLAMNYRSETTFALSNGYIGTRGTHEEAYEFDEQHGLEGNFLNGLYEQEHVRYGEWNFGFPTESQTILNVPNCKTIRLVMDGEPMDIRTGTLQNYRRTLDMKHGQVVRSFEWTSPNGKTVRVENTRFVSLAQKNRMAQRYSVTPVNFSGTLTLHSALDADVENHTRTTNPLVDYGPFGRHLLPDALTADDKTMTCQSTAVNSKLAMACGSVHLLSEAAAATRHQANDVNAWIEYDFAAEQGHTITLEKLTVYTDSLDMDKNAMLPFVNEELAAFAADGYGKEFAAHAALMEHFWETADIRVDGDVPLQQGLRFNLYHIMQASGRDGRTGMGAKGLSGEGYEGHYFWDTEMYVLPVFVYTQPELARSLLDYRYSTLDKARDRARVLGHPIGALYPWRTINGEEASTYFPLGTAQYHINADVAYAFQLYVAVTNDIDYLADKAAEVLCETARVWADVGCFAECRGGKYCICSVTGPDEYNAIVDNNFYTNLMAQQNLYAAVKALKTLKEQRPNAYQKLIEKIQLDPDEPALWKKTADAMYFAYDEKRQVYLQDDGFMLRKPWDDSRIPPEKRHLLYENYHPLFIYRQRMSKQADAIMGMMLYSALFTDEELLRNYDFYQTVTLHHSSLSTCIFGILASRIGRHEDAYTYFAQSARMDLDDYHDNFYAGIHAANMAGTWQSIVFGFAGLRLVNGVPEFKFYIPEAWNGYHFTVKIKESVLAVDVLPDGWTITLQSGDTVNFLVEGKPYELTEKGQPAMKHYKAIFFDWDGTAVLSRKAPVEDAVNAMRPLLDKGVKLCIVSGTTYENIAGGKLHSYFTPKQLENLYLGLGRGAFDCGYDAAGQPTILVDRVPDAKGILAVHDACYRIHRELLEKYGMNTDIVFSRPNYCKIDLMPANNRGENLFLQEGEAARLQHILQQHGIDSIETVIAMAESFGTPEMPLRATTDAKYLEVGPTGKSDNVDALFARFGFAAEDCCFWGDEFIGVTDSIFGSDAGMLTQTTQNGDFYDVSDLKGVRPEQVKKLGGGIQTFLNFLREQ